MGLEQNLYLKTYSNVGILFPTTGAVQNSYLKTYSNVGILFPTTGAIQNSYLKTYSNIGFTFDPFPDLIPYFYSNIGFTFDPSPDLIPYFYANVSIGYPDFTKINTTPIAKAYVGTTEVDKVYIENFMIYLKV